MTEFLVVFFVVIGFATSTLILVVNSDADDATHDAYDSILGGVFTAYNMVVLGDFEAGLYSQSAVCALLFVSAQLVINVRRPPPSASSSPPSESLSSVSYHGR